MSHDLHEALSLAQNPGRYYSRFSPGKKVTLAQYITEIICERKALIDGGGDLPNKFWEIKKWRSFFKSQIPTAHTLCKNHRGDAILSALKDKKTKGTYSLRSPFLVKVIKEYEKKPPSDIETLEEPIERIYYSKGVFNNKKSDLEDLD